MKDKIDYIFLPVGLASGVGSYFYHISPYTKIIGVEPKGAPSMSFSFIENKVIELKNIDKDGAGLLNFNICKKVCTTILDLYNLEAIVAEPAGALSISALDIYSDKIKM